MYRWRLAAALFTSALFTIEFTYARITHGQIDAGITAAWLLSLGWVFGGGVRDAIQRRNGNGNGD